MSGSLDLVLGGVRSGKSRFAFERAMAVGCQVLFVATGVSTDDEMAERIARHRAQRPPHWITLERRFDLASAIAESEGDLVLVEDIGTLVANLLVERSAGKADVDREVQALLDCQLREARPWLVVSQEAGLGLVPESPLGRHFLDLLGWANQLIAAEATSVVMIVAGLPVRIKG